MPISLTRVVIKLSEKFSLDFRENMLNAIPEDNASDGTITSKEYIYLPDGHAKALHPDKMLVTGMRGAGKTFWWKALNDDSARSFVNSLNNDIEIGESTIVSKGFGSEPSPNDYPNKEIFRELLSKGNESQKIWRTIILFHLLNKNNDYQNHELLHSKDWSERVSWVNANTQEIYRLLYEIDNDLITNSQYHLILFDALDRTADDWNSMNDVIKGLMQILVEFRTYNRIRPKAFLRTDQINERIFIFADSSKLRAQIVELNWPPRDLYSLLWQRLSNSPATGEEFRNVSNELLACTWEQKDNVWIVPRILRIEENQRQLFHAITGPWMGSDARRGNPYSWLPNHLGDTKHQVSPRSFLAALRKALEDKKRDNHEFPIHYENIKRGVQAASQIRVNEMAEDYPWVSAFMKPLEDLTIPCDFKLIEDKWKTNNVFSRVNSINIGDAQLPPQHINEGAEGIRKDMEELFLFSNMSDGRVTMPDVFRVGYGIKMRGGIRKLKNDS